MIKDRFPCILYGTIINHVVLYGPKCSTYAAALLGQPVSGIKYLQNKYLQEVLASCFLGAWRATCKYLGLTLLDYVRCTMFKRGYSGNNVEHPAACCNK